MARKRRNTKGVAQCPTPKSYDGTWLLVAIREMVRLAGHGDIPRIPFEKTIPDGDCGWQVIGRYLLQHYSHSIDVGRTPRPAGGRARRRYKPESKMMDTVREQVADMLSADPWRWLPLIQGQDNLSLDQHDKRALLDGYQTSLPRRHDWDDEQCVEYLLTSYIHAVRSEKFWVGRPELACVAAFFGINIVNWYILDKVGTQDRTLVCETYAARSGSFKSCHDHDTFKYSSFGTLVLGWVGEKADTENNHYVYAAPTGIPMVQRDSGLSKSVAEQQQRENDADPQDEPKPEVVRTGSGTETPQPRVGVAQPGRKPSADGMELTAGTASTESESEEPQNGEEAMVASAQRLSLVSTQNSHEAQQWLQHEWQSTTERWENLPRDTDRQTFAEKVEDGIRS